MAWIDDARRMMLIAVTACFLSACGGGGSGSNGSDDSGETPKAPQLQAKSGVRQVTLTWSSVKGADSYNLYHATEPGIEPDNYGAFNSGTLIQDVTSPYTVGNLNTSPVYHFVITSNSANESGPSDEVIALTRYDERGDNVVDVENSLEWRRCVYDQSWEADSRSCVGDSKRIDRATAFSLADNGWRLPTRAELLTLAFCSNNDPSYFPESRQGCSFTDDEPDAPTIWESVFPNSPNDANYQTNSACGHSTWSTVSFADGSSGLCAGANQATYLRQVRTLQ